MVIQGRVPAKLASALFCTPGTVYEEYGRSYADMGMIQKAMDYLDKAEQGLPSTKFWELLIKTSRASALVRGNEIEAGVELAVQTTEEIKSLGVLRYLDRIKILNAYLEQLENNIHKMRKPLSEALYGGTKLDY